MALPMPQDRMTLDLLATLDVVDDDVTAVVNAYLADPGRGMVAFGDGFRIDHGAAVDAHPFARRLMGQSWAGEGLRHAAVRAAIMLTYPERA